MSRALHVPAGQDVQQCWIQRLSAKRTEVGRRIRRHHHGGQIRGRRRLRFVRAPPRRPGHSEAS
jgi:hypothetical protein